MRALAEWLRNPCSRTGVGRLWPCLLAAAGVLALGVSLGRAPVPATAAEAKRPEALMKADTLFKAQNWKDAAAAYRDFIPKAKTPEDAWHASMQLTLSYLRLGEFDSAIEAAQAMVPRFKGTVREARAERALGNLYLLLPHWGTEKGGRFLRGRREQGTWKHTYALDRKNAVAHLERARDLYSGMVSARSAATIPIESERLDALFDLAAAVTRFGPYDRKWRYWWYAWGEEEEDDGTVSESHGMSRGEWELGQVGRPNGIPVNEAGQPIWDPVPAAYSPDLPPGQKMKFLLHEIERLDRSETGEHAALALYRRAMLARARYGPDRLQQFAGWWDGGARPYADEIEKRHLYDLADDEVLTLLGTRLAVVNLPADEDVTRLLREVVQRYPKAAIAGEAQYALGAYFQAREQYQKALAEYAGYRERFPRGERIGAVREQERVIRLPEVRIDPLGVQLAGDPATLPITYRNAKQVHFRAYTLDLNAYLNDVLERIRQDKQDEGIYGLLQNLPYALLWDRGPNRPALYKKYLGKLVAEWDSPVEEDSSHRYATARVTTPLNDRGCRIIEATVEGGRTSRALLLIQDLAIVEKHLKGQLLHYVCDARTGQPAQGAKLHYFQFWHRWEKRGAERTERQHWTVVERGQDADDAGISLFNPETRFNGQQPQVIAIARVGDDRFAFLGVQGWGYYNPASQWTGFRAILFTDRPVYRPGQKVRAKVWCRRYENGVYGPPKFDTLQVDVRDPKGKILVTKYLRLDAYGGGSFEYTLEEEAPLGVYTVGSGPTVQLAGNQFRVEEYKKPEYEVTVEPTTDLAKLGDKVTGVVRARYYFGAPVTNATVKYRIYRQDYTFSYTEPGPWDWLYGVGYGCVAYDYRWFPWWRRWGCLPDIWYPWWGPPRRAERELVSEGEARIGEDGTVRFTIDTAPAREAHPDKDHVYTVEAEVRDASRRVIEGSGQVKVARQEFYTYVSVDRGYYRPGDQAEVTVRTLTPAGQPVAVKGKVSISRVRYTGENNTKILEEPEQTWDAATDAEGKLSFPVKAGKSGQYKIAFESAERFPSLTAAPPDQNPPGLGGRGATSEPILGAAVIWVAGGDFDGRIYRFADLEILTDKRTYAVGETAHLMINTAREGTTVLFSHHLDGGVLTNYQLLSLPQRSKVVDVVVQKGDVPNFFVEATTVFDGREHHEAREICVPPTEGMVHLAVTSDKPEYRPGEKGRISVTATTPEGKPVRTQVALTAFDRSVLYIQPEYTPDIRAWYWGQKRGYYPQTQSTLDVLFNAYGQTEDPRQSVSDLKPKDWLGSWGRHWANWATDDEQTLEQLDGMAGGGRFTFAETYADKRMAGAMYDSVAAVPSAPGMGGGMMGAPAAAPVALSVNGAVDAQSANGAGAPAYQAAQVRTQFADTALWLADLETGDDGKATTEITFPENLTTWKVRALGMTCETRVGDAEASATTTKKLLVRLQAPRFFMERDRVTITANVHNYLPKAKRAKVTLSVGEGALACLRLDGKPETTVEVPAGGEAKVDWEVTVTRDGNAVVKVEALTDEESDAMQMAFPALVHGIEKTVSTTGSLPPGKKHVAEVKLEIPRERDPSASRLEVRFSPSLAGAILDALPYLLEYPYGCTEQTMSRFLPAVMVQRTLQRMGLNLEELATRRANLNAQELGTPEERRERWRRFTRDPVFNTAELDKIVRDGLERLTDFQHGDGGWGWWREDESSPYTTAYVVWGLHLATGNDVPVEKGILDRGFQALQNGVRARLSDWQESKGAGNEQAFLAYVLSLRKLKNDELNALLFERRAYLTPYGKALLSIAFRNLGDVEKADLLLQNIRQREKRDDENETTWFDTAQSGWWFWWNNDIETNAWILQAIVAKDPKDPAAPRLIKWLLNNRRNGWYWRSTRDTALCAVAFIEYMRAVGEDRPDYTLRVSYDGKRLKDVKITRENFLSFDNRLVIAGDALTSGKHTLTIERVGDGALYYNTYLSYFTKEEGIRGAGLEVKVDRRYYRLERADRDETATGSRLQEVKERRVRYRRIPLKEGDRLKSGDLVEVELRLISKNDYDYLVFEDMKAAGLEPVEVRSGGHWGELCSNMELRDEKVAFFVGYLEQGEHLIQYRMRAEIPGTFHALPTRGWAMYAPELRANSDEAVLRVTD